MTLSCTSVWLACSGMYCAVNAGLPREQASLSAAMRRLIPGASVCALASAIALETALTVQADSTICPWKLMLPPSAQADVAVNRASSDRLAVIGVFITATPCGCLGAQGQVKTGGVLAARWR